MTGRVRILTVALVAGVQLAAARGAIAQGAASPGDTYEALYERYLASARSAGATGTDVGWMVSLAGDLRARQLNDLVTIRVVESITATGVADASLVKNSDGKVAGTSFFGAEHYIPKFMNPSSLVAGTFDTKFKGGGATTRSGELTATVTARVVEVLPNGDLVLEGAREIDINGDRQIVVLTGVLRPSDVLPGNQAWSTSIGQLRIRYFGRGLMKDNLKPGWLIRVLNKIF